MPFGLVLAAHRSDRALLKFTFVAASSLQSENSNGHKIWFSVPDRRTKTAAAIAGGRTLDPDRQLQAIRIVNPPSMVSVSPVI